MKGRNRAVSNWTEHRKMKLVDVKVQDVELFGVIADAVEHKHIVRVWIPNAGAEAQRQRRTTHQPAGRDGVPTRKQSNVVSLPAQLFAEIRYDSFGAPV